MYNPRAFAARSASSPLASTSILRRDPRENVQIEILFCGKHNITSDVEVIPLKSDVKYRFSIDMASLKS